MRTCSRRATAVALLACLAVLAACQRGTPPAATGAPAGTPVGAAAAAAWSVFIDEYLEAYFKAHPHYAAGLGRHEFDGLLPDWSAAGIRAEIARLKTLRARATALPATRLDAAQRFERDYLLARIDRDVFWVELAEEPFRNPAFYLGTEDGNDSLDPSIYVVRPYGTPEQRLRAFIKYAHAVARVAPDIRANLRVPMPATYIKLGVAGFGGLADFYRKDVPTAFAGVGDAALKAELKAAIQTAATAMQGLADWLKSEQPRATGPAALGAMRYAQMLSMTERVELPLAQLEAAGRADLERNTAALREACAQFAPGKSLAACVARMSAHKLDGGVVAGARAQLAGLRQFIVDHDVASIPGTDDAQVAEAPPFNRQNFAYLDTPGPYEERLPSIYYIAPPDPAWSKKEQDAYLQGVAFMLFTSVHEVWPGHFLQFLHSKQVASRFARVQGSYAFTEGWAHYAEELMWEKGLGGDPESHIGELVNALMRDARFLASISLHTQGGTVADAERLFRERAFMDPGFARQQAARGTYDPAYLNYTLGKLMIRKLRSDWCASRGGERAWKDFNDRLLSYGYPPVPLVRAAMLPGDTSPVL